MFNPLREIYDAVKDADRATNDKVRAWCNRHYGFAIPTEEAIKKIASYAPIVEIGAGLGYWASLIWRHGGAHIDCYDTGEQGEGNKWGNFHHHVYQAPASAVLRGNNPFRRSQTLLLIWPSVKDNGKVVSDCLDRYEGNTILYVGEFEGINGWDKRLETEWYVRGMVTIPCWPCFHDALYILERKNGI